MKSTSRMTRRSVLGGLLTAGAVAALPEGIAHGESSSTARATPVPLSAATPGLDYERFSAISFIPYRTIDNGYRSVSTGLQFNGPGSQTFVCPFGPAHGSTLKEPEFYIETGSAAGATLYLIRGNNDGIFRHGAGVCGCPHRHRRPDRDDPPRPSRRPVNYDYELWVTFHFGGTFRGARVASVAPTGLITVPQNRKLDTRAGAKPVAGSVTTVDLAPDVSKGARRTRDHHRDRHGQWRLRHRVPRRSVDGSEHIDPQLDDIEHRHRHHQRGQPRRG